MLYTPAVKRALKLCFDAHKYQMDKSGLPYVFHPFHLAEQMESEDTIVVALLHDVVEDTPYTLKDLRDMGFGQQITDAIALMTHDERVPYLEYVRRIRKNPIARAVKIADLQHNSDTSRLEAVSEMDRWRVLKYKMALAVLAEDAYDECTGRYRKRIPLDGENLYFLSVFYTREGVCKYSLDVERASDAHYAFGAEAGEQILKLFPYSETLPSALAQYLAEHSEHQFAKLLSENKIEYQSFHFD